MRKSNKEMMEEIKQNELMIANNKKEQIRLQELIFEREARITHLSEELYGKVHAVPEGEIPLHKP